MSSFSPRSKDSKILLSTVDEFATANVIAGRGGPFGASLHVYTHGDETYHQIGDLSANAVLQTGMGSAHAEDQMLAPQHVEELKNFLRALPDDQEKSVILSSSGESCPSCHSKIEIVSRKLIEEGLISRGDFLLLYGATYKQTHEVAKFNDEPYLFDMQAEVPSRQIQQEFAKVSELPNEVKAAFENADRAVSVIEFPNGEFIIANEDRANDIIATSEVSVIRAAASHQKAQDMETPWDLGGARLYTSTSDIGSLGYSEGLWANISKWVTVEHSNQNNWSTQEATDISNSQFFDVITTRPYNSNQEAVTVLHIKDFENKAQKKWREILDKTDENILYNGADVSNTPS